MTEIDHIAVLLFAVLYPAYDFFYASKKFHKEAEANKPGARIRSYRVTIAAIWILCLFTIFTWIVNYREFEVLGLHFTADWTLWVALALLILGLAYIIYLYYTLKKNGKQRSAVRSKMEGKHTTLFLPKTPREYRGFVCVSISAGICEEILYRGFLIWYFDQFTPLVVAVLFSSLLFGFAHAYQGKKGILQSGISGIVMAVLYLLTGTLWIPIVLHMVIDAYSGMLGWVAFDETSPSSDD